MVFVLLSDDEATGWGLISSVTVGIIGSGIIGSIGGKSSTLYTGFIGLTRNRPSPLRPIDVGNNYEDVPILLL